MTNQISEQALLTSEILLTDDQLKAIGCLTVEVSRIESLLDCSIQALCRFNDIQKEIFIGKWMLGVKIKAAKDLFRPKLRSKTKLQSFDAMFAKLNDLITRRNAIVHGEWATLTQRNWLTPNPERGSDAFAKHKTKNLTIKAADIMDIASGLSACHRELFHFFYQELILKRTKASLKKSLQQPHR